VARLVAHHRATVGDAGREIVAASTILLGSAGLAIAFGRDLPRGTLGVSLGEASSDIPGVFLGILATNLGTAFLMFAGLVTFGLFAIAVGSAAGMFLGHSIVIAVAELGAGEVIVRTVLYSPLEVYGFTLALASGLTCVIDVLFRNEGSVRDGLRRARHRSLCLIAHAVLVLVLAAVVEALSLAAWSV